MMGKRWFNLVFTSQEVDRMRFSKISNDLFKIDIHLTQKRFVDVLTEVLNIRNPTLEREIQLALTVSKCPKCGEYKDVKVKVNDSLIFVCGVCGVEWSEEVK